jgi:hypothetical protein
MCRGKTGGRNAQRVVASGGVVGVVGVVEI